MYPTNFNPQHPALPGQAPNGFQGQGGPYAAGGFAPGAPQVFPGQGPNGFVGQGGPFAQPVGQLPPQGMGQMPMNTQAMPQMPPQYQQGMNQSMRPPAPAQAQNPYLASNLGFGRR